MRKYYNQNKLQDEFGPENNRFFDIAVERVYQGDGRDLVFAGRLPDKMVWFIQKGTLPGEFEYGLFYPRDEDDTELDSNGKYLGDTKSFFRELNTLDEIVNSLNLAYNFALER